MRGQGMKKRNTGLTNWLQKRPYSVTSAEQLLRHRHFVYRNIWRWEIVSSTICNGVVGIEVTYEKTSPFQCKDWHSKSFHTCLQGFFFSLLLYLCFYLRAVCVFACLLWDTMSCSLVRLAHHSLCIWGWPWNDPPDLTSWVLELSVWTTLPGLSPLMCITHLTKGENIPCWKPTLFCSKLIH